MITYDVRLKELQNRIYEKRHIECKLKNLQKQEADLAEQVKDLYAKKSANRQMWMSFSAAVSPPFSTKSSAKWIRI